MGCNASKQIDDCEMGGAQTVPLADGARSMSSGTLLTHDSSATVVHQMGPFERNPFGARKPSGGGVDSRSAEEDNDSDGGSLDGWHTPSQELRSALGDASASLTTFAASSPVAGALREASSSFTGSVKVVHFQEDAIVVEPPTPQAGGARLPRQAPVKVVRQLPPRPPRPPRTAPVLRSQVARLVSQRAGAEAADSSLSASQKELSALVADRSPLATPLLALQPPAESQRSPGVSGSPFAGIQRFDSLNVLSHYGSDGPAALVAAGHARLPRRSPERRSPSAERPLSQDELQRQESVLRQLSSREVSTLSAHDIQMLIN
jgi:hypothetical protein